MFDKFGAGIYDESNHIIGKAQIQEKMYVIKILRETQNNLNDTNLF